MNSKSSKTSLQNREKSKMEKTYAPIFQHHWAFLETRNYFHWSNNGLYYSLWYRHNERCYFSLGDCFDFKELMPCLNDRIIHSKLYEEIANNGVSLFLLSAAFSLMIETAVKWNMAAKVAAQNGVTLLIQWPAFLTMSYDDKIVCGM